MGWEPNQPNVITLQEKIKKLEDENKALKQCLRVYL
jgi:hypothetical protein